MAKSLRPFLFSVFIIALCAMVAGVLAPQGTAKAAPPSEEDQLSAGLKQFTAIYSLVEQNSAEKVVADRSIYKGAVPGMLRTLDPHSSFFDPRRSEERRVGQDC